MENATLDADVTELPGRIRLARKARGSNQTEVAVALGLERSAVSNWEQGRTSPSLVMTQKLANLLDVNVMWLAFGVSGSGIDDHATILQKYVRSDGTLYGNDAEYVRREFLADSTGQAISIKDAILMTSVVSDDLGEVGQVVLIDTSIRLPTAIPSTYAIARPGMWFSARLTTDPLEENKVAIFSESLRVDKTVDADSIQVIGRVASVFHRMIH